MEIKGTTGLSQLVSSDAMETDGLDYLGMLFRVDREQRHLHVTPRKRSEWLEEAKHSRKRVSVREAAGWIGRAIFAAMCSGRPIIRIDGGRSLLDLAREVGGRGRCGWDRVCPEELRERTQAVCYGIIEASEYRLPLEGSSGLRPRSGADWVLTPDASNTHCGWIIYRMGRERLIREGPKGLAAGDVYHSSRWQEKEHIFLLEMRAAVGVLRTFRGVQARGPATLVLDNSAAYYALQNGMTASRRGQEITDVLHEDDLEDIDLVLAPSEQNPADCPSRGRDNVRDLTTRQDRLFQVLSEHRKGRQVRATDRREFEGAWQGVRHQEGADEEWSFPADM